MGINILRENVTAVDGSLPTDKKPGINLTGYDAAIVDVDVDPGVTCTVQVVFWSELSDSFVVPNDVAPVSVTAPTQFYVPHVAGRRLWVQVTALAGGTISAIGVSSAESTAT